MRVHDENRALWAASGLAVAILKGEGRTVGAHYEGLGFVRREDQIDAPERTIAWFDQYLKGAK